MYEEMKFWSSTLVVKEGDVVIDISLAAKGMSSSVPVGAQQQNLPYPGTFYRFDPCLFYGQNTELDLDQAENLDLVENRLYALMKLPSTVDGCTMVMKQHSVKVTCHRRRSWTFLCSHGTIMREQRKHLILRFYFDKWISNQKQKSILLSTNLILCLFSWLGTVLWKRLMPCNVRYDIHLRVSCQFRANVSTSL